MAEVARLRILQITDVYTLKNFPSLKTLINEKREEINKLGGKTISMLTGDFLAPYLLSSLDKGVGMMNMLNKTPIDYLTWGNHEHDIDHASVMRRTREYKGVWINSNMKSHESFKVSKCQVDSEVIQIVSPDGSNKRKLGMCAVLTNDPNSYKPGAFGGATIDDPWECLEQYNAKLRNEEGCDMVLPLCHLYEHQDERTCRKFDFPVVMGGHDHHRVDRVVNGTRLLKPGMDADYAVILDLVWESGRSDSIPIINASTIPVANFAPDEVLAEEVSKAYSILDPLYKTDLAIIPKKYSPLTSKGARLMRVSMATYICSQLRLALNLDTEKYTSHCDCVVVRGMFKGNRDYETFNFTLEALKSELSEKQEVHIFRLPGHILQKGMNEAWNKKAQIRLQYDDGVELNVNGQIETIGGMPFHFDRIYRVGSFKNLSAKYEGQSTLNQYFKENPKHLPEEEAGIGCHVLLLQLFSRDIWRRLLNLLDADRDGVITPAELKVLDIDGDGKISKEELRSAITNIMGLSAVEGEDTLLDYVLTAGGDRDNDGQLTVEEINESNTALVFKY